MTLPDETVWNYGYDYENRLTSVTDNDSYTAAYSYSADGLRLRAQESNHQFPDRWFLYDGVRPTAEGTLSGDTWTTTERYVWEGDSYYDPLVYLVWDNDRYYPLFDGLGSTRQLADEDQAVTDTYSYEAFGNLLGSTGSTVNPYRYVGSLGYYQTGSSLMQLGRRYYMPEIGRFIQQDPRQPDDLPGRLQRALELDYGYLYAAASPTSYVDADGEGIIGAIRCGICLWKIGRVLKECTDKTRNDPNNPYNWDPCDTESETPKPFHAGDTALRPNIKCINKKLGKNYYENCMKICGITAISPIGGPSVSYHR